MFNAALGQYIIKGETMIKCKGCSMLVHVDCDFMLSDLNIRRQIMPERIEGEPIKVSSRQPQYKCPVCRRANRNNLLEDVIDVLIANDKQKHFLSPFWEVMQPQAQ